MLAKTDIEAMMMMNQCVGKRARCSSGDRKRKMNRKPARDAILEYIQEETRLMTSWLTFIDG